MALSHYRVNGSHSVSFYDAESLPCYWITFSSVLWRWVTIVLMGNTETWNEPMGPDATSRSYPQNAVTCISSRPECLTDSKGRIRKTGICAVTSSQVAMAQRRYKLWRWSQFMYVHTFLLQSNSPVRNLYSSDGRPAWFTCPEKHTI